MVSLDPNTRNTGARFLADNMNPNEDDRAQLMDAVLSTESENNFKPLKTIPHFSIHLLISTAISFLGVLLAIIWTDEKRCKAYFIMLWCRAGFWIITFIINHVVKKHHDDLRMNGYHEFNRSTKMQKEIPLYIVSFWNAVIIAIQTLIHDYYGPHFAEHCIMSFFSPIVYITAFSVLETFVLAAVEISYMAQVCRFNKSAPPPDALTGRLGSGTVGFIQPGASITELLEAQADLISYYKEQSLQLNIKLMQLNSQIRRLQRI